MNIRCFQHTESTASTYLPAWAARHRHAWACTLVPAVGELPPLAEVDCLVVMGGPMSVWQEERFPWLRAEKRYMEQFLAAGKPLLAICLGAQLLADVLGARVYAGPHKEIGWHRAETSGECRGTWLGEVLPPSFETFLWHGDTFDLPQGAVAVARSAAFANQGFLWGSALALQFHLEVSPAWVRMLAERDAEELAGGRYVQTAEHILSKPEELYHSNNALMDGLLRRWLGTIGGG